MGNPAKEQQRKAFDEGFIRLLRAKDEKSYKALRTFCRDYAVQHTEDLKAANEIASQTILKVIQAIHAFDPVAGRGNIEANFKRWVKTIAYHCFVDERKREQKMATFSSLAVALNLNDMEKDALETDYASIDDMLSAQVYAANPEKDSPGWITAVKEVFAVIARLKPVRKRIAVLLKYYCGFTTQDVALIMNEKFDAVQTLIHRTRKELCELFLKKGIDVHYLDKEFWRIKHLSPGPAWVSKKKFREDDEQ